MQDRENVSPNPGPSKSVSIAEPITESHSLDTLGDDQTVEGLPTSSRQHRASIGKKLSGRAVANVSTTSLSSVGDIAGNEVSREQRHTPSHHQHRRHQLTSKVGQWLATERLRQRSRRQKKLQRSRAQDASEEPLRDSQASSDSSDEDALAKLEQILADAGLDEGDFLAPGEGRRPSHGPRKRSSKYSLRRKSTAASSDTDYADGDIYVPSAEVVLDNTKTLRYSNSGTEDSTTDVSQQAKRKEKGEAAWLTFKNEIVRLAHTLKLKNWRRIPLEYGGKITVERLSGAMTNAVYVVAPPPDLLELTGDSHQHQASNIPKRLPPNLLLRIYGPQVEHLIDRENELGILRRLARKRIGPRLLGTFSNGRFEQFFQARTLTADDIRAPETSKQIAKRMRELHEGVELLAHERSAGPFAWQNWDKWIGRCDEVGSWLDDQILSEKAHRGASTSEAWRSRGFVCGVEWPMFRKTVEKYRVWLERQYGGPGGIRDELVFAHNDAQYGNLLRLQPSGESPLLTPANEHKQLIVIDFEYANANLQGYEFANHFTEWCYNYHDPKIPYAVTEAKYPTPEEQHRFVKAYVTHRPAFPSTVATPAATPGVAPSSAPATRMASFMLDARTPYSQYQDDDKKKNEEDEKEIARLLRDTRNWRTACSAQWVAWGIVQAKIKGMDEALDRDKQKGTTFDSDTSSHQSIGTAQHTQDKQPDIQGAEPLTESKDMSAQEDDEAEFDYLGYANERALFFWGDVLQLDIVKREELPEHLLERLKVVEY